MAKADWKKWQESKLARVRGLFGARSPVEIEALRADCPAAAADELIKARELLKRIASALEGGDAAVWRRLALAFEVADVGSSHVDDEPPVGSANPDTTLPAARESPSFSESAPSSISADKTLAVGEVRIEFAAEDGAAARGSASRPAGSTLPEAAQPSGSRSNATVKMAAFPGAGTAPIEPVPSSVLDIEKYAVLCAWTEAHPQRREQLHQQYGLASEEERRRLDESFASLFQKDLRLRGAFEKRLRLHLGYLRGASG